MARALFKHWSSLVQDGTLWKQGYEAHVTDGGSQWTFSGEIQALENDSAQQIKAKVSEELRDRVFNEFAVTIEANQIIWPDCTRT